MPNENPFQDPYAAGLTGVYTQHQTELPYKDVMEFLLYEYQQAGRLDAAKNLPGQEAIADFADFAHEYLCNNPPISSGISGGNFALVFSGGLTLPLTAPDTNTPNVAPGFSSNTGARHSMIQKNMMAMPVDSTAVAVTTGRIGQDQER